MSINVGPYVIALHDIAAASGLFDIVLDHEPTSAPGTEGLTCCVIGSTITGIQSSGLASLSARVEFRVRILANAFDEPRSAVDTILMNAAGEYMGELAGAYALGGLARDVDLLGADGDQLRMELGYMSIGGNSQTPGSVLYRAADVMVPIVINDCWTMAE